MKGILIDKNDIEAYISFPDGNITCIPAVAVSSSSVGDSITMSNISIHISQGFNPNQNLGNDKLIDFF